MQDGIKTGHPAGSAPDVYFFFAQARSINLGGVLVLAQHWKIFMCIQDFSFMYMVPPQIIFLLPYPYTYMHKKERDASFQI